MPLPNKSFFKSLESAAELEEEVFPVEKIAVLCIGAKAAECLKKLSDVNVTSAQEFKQDVGKAETDEVNFILRNGMELLSDPTNPVYFTKPVNHYQVILVCPSDAADLKKYKGLLHSYDDKIIRVMTDDLKIQLGANLLLRLPTPETRSQILQKLYHETTALQEDKTKQELSSKSPRR